MNLETVLQSEACLKMWHPVLQNCNLMGNTQNNFLKEKWLQKFKVGTEVIWYVKLRESSFHTSCNLKLVRFDRLLPAKTEEEKKRILKNLPKQDQLFQIFFSVFLHIHQNDWPSIISLRDSVMLDKSKMIWLCLYTLEAWTHSPIYILICWISFLY